MTKLLNYNSLLGLNADEIYTYLLIHEQIFDDIDLHSISLKNCVLEKCTFEKTILANSDLDSSQISDSIFSNLSFQNSDIVSCNFENCTFKKISFKGSSFSNNTFSNCKFLSCDFNHVDMHNSTFLNCVIEHMYVRQCSTSLNYFIECTFIQSKINGNFFFNILMNCIYKDTEIDISLVSSNFGIRQASLDQLNFSLYNLQDLQDKLVRNNDLFGAAVIELNTNDCSYDYSMLVCLQATFKQIENNIIIRSEELRFIELLLDYFVAEDLLAPITIIQLLSLVEKILNSNINNIAKSKSTLYLNYIYNVLFKAYQQFVSDLHNTLSEMANDKLPVTIKLTFENEPNVEMCAILTDFQKQLNIDSPAPVRIKTEKGSFIDWIQTHDEILKCLQIIISIIGLAIKLKPSSKKISSKSSSNNEAHKSEKSNISQDNSSNNSNIFSSNGDVLVQLPGSIIRQINQVQTEQAISNAVNVFVINNMTINNNYHGINKYNIKNVECFYG